MKKDLSEELKDLDQNGEVKPTTEEDKNGPIKLNRKVRFFYSL